MQMSGRKKATAGTGSVVAAIADHHSGGLIAVPAVGLDSSSGGELKLYLGWKRNMIAIAWRITIFPY